MAVKELTADQEFVKTWWESDTFSEVFENYKNDDNFQTDEEKKTRTKIKTKAKKMRDAGVPMKYFSDRVSGKMAVDKEGLLKYLDDIGITKKEMKDAEKQTEGRKRT